MKIEDFTSLAAHAVDEYLHGTFTTADPDRPGVPKAWAINRLHDTSSVTPADARDKLVFVVHDVLTPHNPITYAIDIVVRPVDPGPLPQTTMTDADLARLAAQDGPE